MRFRARVRTRTGAPWRDVAARYGPWVRSYDLFRGWQHHGTWQGSGGRGGVSARGRGVA
ncbi:transposase [Streptomyces sp. MNP-20]|uniref:transposase n=1 Tax=Streptomyces sp. MNP-20 TaxID=2721165 RepID=UPI002815A836|nr:transposase [Streptomyces sp. MNP-20]